MFKLIILAYTTFYILLAHTKKSLFIYRCKCDLNFHVKNKNDKAQN